jgi:magnesium-transporting ATPase (P-type)
MYCHQCGKEVNSDVKYCPYCGAQLDVHGHANNGDYQPIQPGPTYQREDDAPNFAFALLSFFVPIVGLVLYIIWNKEYPLKAKSCLKGFIFNIVVYVVGICCFMSAFVGIASNEYDHYDGDIYYNAVVQIVPYE